MWDKQNKTPTSFFCIVESASLSTTVIPVIYEISI